MEEINLSELRDKCLNSLFSCSENITKYVDNKSARDEEFDKMKNCVTGYCKMEQQEQAGMKAIQTFEKESDLADWTSLKSQYENKLAQQSKQHVKFDKHPFMKEYERHVKQAVRLQEQSLGSDLAITETISTYIDPLTKRQITNPVRNIICKHVYDKETVDIIVSNSKNKGCPCIGCGNTKPMQVEHLESDRDLMLTIQRSQQTNQIHEEEG